MAEAANKKKMKEMAKQEEAEAFFDDMEAGEKDGKDASGDRRRWEEKRRNEARQFFRKLEETKEWAENNYYRLPIDQHVASRVTTNAFWADYAAHTGKSAFFSEHLAEACSNFTEILFALAVLDLPFEAGEHKSAAVDGRFQLTTGSPAIIFHKEIQPTPKGDGQTPILVSQNYFRHGTVT